MVINRKEKSVFDQKGNKDMAMKCMENKTRKARRSTKLRGRMEGIDKEKGGKKGEGRKTEGGRKK